MQRGLKELFGKSDYEKRTSVDMRSPRKGDEMLCPMKFLLAKYGDKNIIACLKEKCAWWDKQGNQCVLLSLADILAAD